MSVDYSDVWLKATGKRATGAVTVEYEVDIQSEGCCEICYTETTATVTFRLVCETEKVTVSDYDLGLTEY